MKKELIPLMCVVGVAVLVAGCRTPSSGITVESYPRTKITVNSKMVGDRIQVVEYNASKVNDQILMQISVQNTTQKDIKFEYRVEWKDKDGMVIETPLTTWIPFSVSGKETASLKAMAPSSKAEDFTFIVRFSRPSTRW